MEALFHALECLSGAALGTVLHVGAGPGPVLAGYRPWAPSRLVMVEGDPSAVVDLQRLAAGQPGVQVVAQALAAEPGTVSWRRYNLPWLNGPQDASIWQNHYPRLCCTEVLHRQAVTLAALVNSLGLASTEGRALAGAPVNLLVLDVPGQEDALLASLPTAALHKFDAVLVRGCRDRAPEGGAPAQRAVTRLQDQDYDLVPTGDPQEPMWPVALLRFDRVRFEVRSLALRAAELEVLLAQQSQTLAEERASRSHEAAAAGASHARDAQQIDMLNQACEQHLQAAEQHRSQWSSLTAAHEALITQTGELKHRAERAETAQQQLEADAVALRGELARLEQSRLEIEAKANWRASQIELLSRARDEQVRSLAERAQQLAALEQTNRTLESERQQLLARCDETASSLGRTEAEAASLQAVAEQLRQDRDEAVERLQALGTQFEALRELSQADRQSHAETTQLLQLEKTALAAELQAKQAELATLMAQKTEIESKARWRASHIEELVHARDEQAGLVKAHVQRLQLAEAQVTNQSAAHEQALQALQADRQALEASLQAREAAQSQLVEERNHFEQKASWRAGQIELIAKERDAARRQGEATAAELHAVSQARDELQARLDSAQEAASRIEREAATNAARLVDEMAQLQLRQRLLEEEMIRAEGQLELIKDVLLREPGL